MQEPERTPLIYIGGSARSGSTLLERMLAGLPGGWSVGELVFIWERGLRRNDRCGCGERFADCPFWDQVGTAAFGGWSQVDADETTRLRRAVDRHRNLYRISGIRRAGQLAPEIRDYAELTDRLYRGVREVSGASFIVDSSKHVSYAVLLGQVPSVDLRLAHLIRCSHGVAHSWSRRVRKPGVGDGTELMSVHSAAWAVSLWAADNLLYEALARRLQRSTRIRYEDLIADPGAELARAAEALGLRPAGPGANPANAAVELSGTHALSGNPKVGRGQVELRADDEWRTAMSAPRRAAIGAATWPLLARYGYSPAGRARPR